MTEGLYQKGKEFILTYCMTTTATVFVCAIYVSVFWRGALLNQAILWQILLLCFVCSLCNFIRPFRETDRRRIVLNIVVRYLYINLVVLGGGHLFQWLDIANIYMLAVMMLEILFVFLAVTAVMWRLHQKESERLNQKLQEYKSEEEKRRSDVKSAQI